MKRQGGCKELGTEAPPAPAGVRFKSTAYMDHKMTIDDAGVEIVDGHVITEDPALIEILRKHHAFEEVK